MYAYPRHHHQCSSPISDLPVELLSYIFSLSTRPTTGEFSGPDDPAEDHSPPTITTESVRVPLVLSSVNRLWRQVALGTPKLWSNLCITAELVQSLYYPERDLSGFTQHPISKQLNTSHITSYLALSWKSPLNILIDARDENWNFEPEFVPDHGFESYTPAFTSEHMNTIFALLLPHLSRWKSLSILTDCWAPMYTALNAINPFITRFGAPLLESLSLMRCNDLISFSPQFQPHQLREPAFLKRGTKDIHPDLEGRPKMFPSLKYLSLRGVHVDWDALGDSLSTSESGLTWLELAWHSHDVRPSSDQFHKILSSTSGLRNLILSGSGPTISDDAVSIVHHDYDPAHLPHLRNITIGYQTASEGRIALELLDAPNVRELTLEDATYVGDAEVVNAGPLLSYIGTRQSGEAHQNHRITTYELSETLQTTPIDKKALCMPYTHVNKAAESRAVFPLLENLTLRGVQTCSQPLHVFFGALSNLRHLELTRMTMQAIHSLLPSSKITHDDYYTTGTTTTHHNCPCPQLRSLCIRGFEELGVGDIDFIVGGLAVERQNTGACELREVDIHVDAATMVQRVVPHTGSPNMKVNIISDSSDEDEDDEDYYWDGLDVGVDPYEPGGAFNDPFFDAYYSSHFHISR